MEIRVFDILYEMSAFETLLCKDRSAARSFLPSLSSLTIMDQQQIEDGF